MKGIINQKLKKIKVILWKNFTSFFINLIQFFKTDYGFFILILIFSSSVSFFLGKISILYDFEKDIKQESVVLHKKESQKVEFVASKKGSVYHFPWCAGAINLSDKNKIFFDSREDAKDSGYRPAKNCEGL